MFRKTLVFLLCFSLVLCIGCDAGENAKTASDPTNATTDESASVQVLHPVNPDTPVIEAFTDTRTVGQPPITYSCSIPQIQCESAYAQEINKELADIYHNAFNADGIWEGGNASFEWYVNGDILTVVLFRYNAESPTEYEADLSHSIYNLRMSDGSEISDDEILELAGVSKEVFRARAREILGNDFLLIGLPDIAWESILEDPEGNANNANLTQFVVTVSEENLDHLVPYLGMDGTLHFMGRVYHIAGGFDYRTPLFSYYDDFEVSPYYKDMLALTLQ